MRVSISKIKLFKSCRRAYELRYVENLYPINKSEALEAGSNYHSKIEDIYNNGYCDISDMSKVSAMAMAYEKYIYPHFNVTSAEDWFHFDLGNGDELVGITDGLSEDNCIVEHKTTSIEITEQYEYNLLWDEQILAYMLATGRRKVYYTVCRKPTIRQKKGETDEDFFDRMCKWYDEDTEKKIRLLEIERTDEEVLEYEQELHSIVNEMKRAEGSNDAMYKCTNYCNQCGRRCEYSSVCKFYDREQEYIEFERREEYGSKKN